MSYGLEVYDAAGFKVLGIDSRLFLLKQTFNLSHVNPDPPTKTFTLSVPGINAADGWVAFAVGGDSSCFKTIITANTLTVTSYLRFGLYDSGPYAGAFTVYLGKY